MLSGINSTYNYSNTAINLLNVNRGADLRGGYNNYIAQNKGALSPEQQFANAIVGRFQSVAKSPNKNLIVKALTGKSLQELPPSQQAAMRKFLAALADGTIKAPNVILAQNGSVEAGSAKETVLPEGVNGAFVKTGGAGTILISRTLFEKDRKAANEILEHEVGHALGHAAQQFNVKVAEGEDGERMRLAVDGKDPTNAAHAAGKNLFDPKSEMHGTVKINGVAHQRAEFSSIDARVLTFRVFQNLARAIVWARANLDIRYSRILEGVVDSLRLVARNPNDVPRITLPVTRWTIALGRNMAGSTNEAVFHYLSNFISFNTNPARVPGDLGEAATSFFRRFDLPATNLVPLGYRGNKLFVPSYNPNDRASKVRLAWAVANALTPAESPDSIDGRPVADSAAIHPVAAKITQVMHEFFLANGYPQPGPGRPPLPNDQLVAQLNAIAANLPSTSRASTAPQISAWGIAQGLNGIISNWHASYANGFGLSALEAPFLAALYRESPEMFGTLRMDPAPPLSAADVRTFVTNYLHDANRSFPSLSSAGRPRPMIDIILGVLQRPEHRNLLAELLRYFVFSRMSAAAKARRFPPPPPPPAGTAVMATSWPLFGVPRASTINLPLRADFRRVGVPEKLGRAANQAFKEALGQFGADFVNFVKRNPGTTAAVGVGIGALVAIQFVPGVNVAVDSMLGAVGALLYAMQGKVTIANIKAGLAGFSDFLKFGISAKTGLEMNRAKNGFKVFLQKIGTEAFKLLMFIADVVAVGRGAASLVNLAQKAGVFFKGLRAAEILSVAGQKTVTAFRNFGKWVHDVTAAKGGWRSWHFWKWHPVQTATNWLTKLWSTEGAALGGSRPRYPAASPATRAQRIQMTRVQTNRIVDHPGNRPVFLGNPENLRRRANAVNTIQGVASNVMTG